MLRKESFLSKLSPLNLIIWILMSWLTVQATVTDDQFTLIAWFCKPKDKVNWKKNWHYAPRQFDRRAWLFSFLAKGEQPIAHCSLIPGSLSVYYGYLHSGAQMRSKRFAVDGPMGTKKKKSRREKQYALR